jgi:hypothetical protein
LIHLHQESYNLEGKLLDFDWLTANGFNGVDQSFEIVFRRLKQ